MNKPDVDARASNIDWKCEYHIAIGNSTDMKMSVTKRIESHFGFPYSQSILDAKAGFMESLILAQDERWRRA